MSNYVLKNNSNFYLSKLNSLEQYFDYSTQSNSIPSSVTANSTGDGQTGGNANSANYNFGADWNGSNGNLTTVGTNGGPSFYGTYDQTGQVWEWNDAISANARGVRGGSWLNTVQYIGSSFRGFSGAGPGFGNGNVGFRICCGANESNALFETLLIKNAFNDNDSLGFGRVDYLYRIGKYPITNNIYCLFLNLKAKSDPHLLYNNNMGSTAYGGIIRSGSSGSYVYTVKNNMHNKPVVYISWFDAARFANWMHNGANNGDTETGAYTLNGALSGIFIKNTNSKFWIPTEDEWYKAAYYKQTQDFYIRQ